MAQGNKKEKEMFTLTIPNKNHDRILKALKPVHHVEADADGGTMNHDSGLKLDFKVSGDAVSVTVVANPQRVPEDQIKSRLDADVVTLSKSA